MSHDEIPDTCKFGHKVDVYDHNDTGAPNGSLRAKIESGEISSLEEYEQEAGTDSMVAMLGDTYKQLKVSAKTAGTPYMISWTCADKFDEDLEYDVQKTSEDIFVTPQNQLHDEFMQRKQQAEQRISQSLGSLSDLKKQKHLLEHDIRKLRSRAEAFDTGEEVQLKADFVELVDGAGGGAQQGADEAPLKTLRDQNIYPSIVADFYEMNSLDDLKTEKQRDDGESGILSHLPANEKAILKKKWVMYEKWKDLYGSEIQRKLKDLKSQLHTIERGIDQTEKQMAPYVRDVVMINQEDEDHMADLMNFYPSIRGTATMRRDIEFICAKPMKNDGESIRVIRSGDESEATHYRIIVIMSVHVNLSGAKNPNTPADGPSSAVIAYYPGIVCKHVYENIIQEKIEKNKNRFRDLLKDYTGDYDNKYGQELKQARESKNWSVRKLREEVNNEVDGEAPIEFSSYIRRLEDGLDGPEAIAEDFGGKYLDVMEELLDVKLQSKKAGADMYHGIEKTLREFTGQVDPFVYPEGANPLHDLLMEFKFSYYYDYKLGFGMYTMK